MSPFLNRHKIITNINKTEGNTHNAKDRLCPPVLNAKLQENSVCRHPSPYARQLPPPPDGSVVAAPAPAGPEVIFMNAISGKIPTFLVDSSLFSLKDQPQKRGSRGVPIDRPCLPTRSPVFFTVGTLVH
jgi:hypothetical protein